MAIDHVTPIESSIVSALIAENIDARIDNDPKTTKATPKARILVYFSGETGGTVSLQRTTQRVNLEFLVDVQLADQRAGSHCNIYPIVASVKQALIGFEPTGAAPLEFSNLQYQEMPDGSGVRWRYLLTFSTTTMWRKELGA